MYDTEEANATRFKCDEKTFCENCWQVVSIIANMDLIRFEARNMGGNERYSLRFSIDGTDCRIREPIPFNEKWYSHKFKGPGIRYEIGVAINGPIVWVHGGFPCGEWNDLKIARDSVLELLDDGEKVIADGGYKGDGRIVTPNGLNDEIARIRSMCRARHENVNCLLKNFNVLSHRYRHKLSKHPMCFNAVANIVQADILMSNKLFTINQFNI